MHPILFRIGAGVVPSYGFFLTLGYLISLALVLRLSRKQGLSVKEMAALALFGMAVSILGGKLYLFIGRAVRNPDALVRDPMRLLTMSDGGGGFYGGLIAGLFFALWYLHRYRLPVWKAADVLGTGTALGYAVMKLGCFMGGCCYGRPSGLPWAVRFPGFPGPVHPTQLYEAGLNIFNFIVLYRLLGRKKFDGQVIALDVFINSSVRFLVEYFRGDLGRGFIIRGASPWTSLSTPQLISLTALGAGVSLYVVLARKNREAAPGGEPA